ncbi:MAG: TIGR00341 family protein [Halobacteria archaeon]
MRLIHAIVPSDRRDKVIEILEDRDVDYAVMKETSNRKYSDVVEVPLPSDDVEGLVDDLRKIGLEKDGYIIVNEVQAIISERFEDLKKEEEKEKEDENGEADGNGDEDKNDGRISRDELKATAQELTKSKLNYIAFTVLSAMVATAGLLTNSAAVVVGSMVIAPLIGPAMASSVGSVIKDDEMFRDGVKLQFLGLGVAIGSATVTAAAARFVTSPQMKLILIQQVAERVNPGLLALVVAIGAGIAGALALTSGVDTALVGVMIAAALVPPAAVAGLGIAYLEPVIIVSSTVLLVLNLLSINLAGLITLWYKGYRPAKWYEEKAAKKITVKRVGTLIIAVLVLSSATAYTTYNHRENHVFEKEVNDLLEGETNVQKTKFTYTESLFDRNPSRVTVYTSEPVEGLANRLKEKIKERTGKDVTVSVIRESVSK